MEERTTGIILRTRPLTETSLIVQWLTPDLGRIATIAKGARRPKSPFRGQLDLFYQAGFRFRRTRALCSHFSLKCLRNWGSRQNCRKALWPLEPSRSRARSVIPNGEPLHDCDSVKDRRINFASFFTAFSFTISAKSLEAARTLRDSEWGAIAR